MIVELIITVIIIFAGCWVVIQLFDFFENEIVRAILIIGYGLFSITMLFHWFTQYISELLTNFM